MVQLMVGRAGSGKTKKMVEVANNAVESANGNIVFITKDKGLMYDLKYFIRFISMEDYPYITNSDEYIGFIYGIISGDHDIETIFIDGILKHADFSKADIPEYLTRLKGISEMHEVNFVVSISAEKAELEALEAADFEIINE